jgi:hypothetical protein
MYSLFEGQYTGSFHWFVNNSPMSWRIYIAFVLIVLILVMSWKKI